MQALSRFRWPYAAGESTQVGARRSKLCRHSQLPLMAHDLRTKREAADSIGRLRREFAVVHSSFDGTVLPTAKIADRAGPNTSRSKAPEFAGDRSGFDRNS